MSLMCSVPDEQTRVLLERREAGWMTGLVFLGAFFLCFSAFLDVWYVFNVRSYFGVS